MKNLFKIPKDSLKVKANQFKVYQTTEGVSRTRTTAQNRKLKEKANFRCAKCKKKFDGAFLDVHHKKSVASHKDKLVGSVPQLSVGKKIKPKYDSDKNAMVLCRKCHQEVHRQEAKKKAKKKKTLSQQLYGDFNF